MSASITVRAAAAGDAAPIRDLTRAAYAKWAPIIGREPLPIAADYEAAIKNHRIDLLYRDGTLAGLIEMIPEAHHLVIENVAVSSSARRGGNQKQLIKLHKKSIESAVSDLCRSNSRLLARYPRTDANLAPCTGGMVI
jgi:hypothetical protein